MATIAQNNIVREVSPKSLFESALPVLSSSVNINQGDLVAFDVTNSVIKSVTGTGDGAQNARCLSGHFGKRQACISLSRDCGGRF